MTFEARGRVVVASLAVAFLFASAKGEETASRLLARSERQQHRGPAVSAPSDPRDPSAGTRAISDPSQIVSALDISASLNPAASITGPAEASAVLERLGVIQPPRGPNFVVLSTGIAGTESTEPGIDWSPQGSLGDSVELRVDVDLPPGNTVMEFRFNFLSAEYPEYIQHGFNDAFRATLTDPNGTREIASADVDSSEFIPASASLAGGSGFDLVSGGQPDGGLTNFVLVRASVTGGGRVSVNFSILDVGDGVVDSAVILDGLSFGALDIVDPHYSTRDPWPEGIPDLLAGDGAWTEDATALSKGGRPVAGAAADGAVELLLRSRVSGPGTVRFRILGDSPEDGGVSLVDASGMEPEVSVPVADVYGEFLAFAVYRVPSDFARAGHPEDIDAIERPIYFEAVHFDEAGSPSTTLGGSLRLVRAPLVLMHGIWSNPRTWTLPIFGSMGGVATDPRFRITYGNYEASSARSLAVNVPHVARAAWEAVDSIRNVGNACSRVDYVGHSMGGLLGRMWSNNPGYRRRSNFGKGDFNRFVTFDTPHTGSPLGNLLNCIVTCEKVPLKVGKYCSFAVLLFDLAKKPIDDGAIKDLAKGSAQINRMLPAEVNAHALVGSLASSESLFGDTQVGKLLEWVFEPLHLFEPMPTDLVVGRDSQIGGLPQSALSEYHTWADAYHLNNTSSEKYSRRLLELLHQDPGGESYSKLPAPSSISNALDVCSWDAWMQAMSGVSAQVASVNATSLEITSPVSGAVFTAGQVISVSLSTDTPEGLQRVLVMADGVASDDRAAPFEAQLVLPPDRIGRQTIHAFGMTTGAGEILTAHPVDIWLIPGGNLGSVEILPRDPILPGPGAFESTQLVGRFSNGTSGPLLAPLFEPTYLTTDPSIVAVEPGGVLRANGPGTATVTAQVGELRDSVSVTVGAIPDADKDGILAIADCDDSNPMVAPGVSEFCDARDNDCNGLVDDDPCVGLDVDQNNAIDGLELAWMGRAWGSSSSDPSAEWWSRIDYNHDGWIDGVDLAILAVGFGRDVRNCDYRCPEGVGSPGGSR